MARKSIGTRSVIKHYKHTKKIHPKLLPKTLSITGSDYNGNYCFSCENDIPIYEVYTVHALNQLIGHAKFNNQSYGNVYYRGECKLHSSIKPSLYRNVKNVEKANERLSKLIQKFIDDPHMKRELKIDTNDIEISRHKIEGMFQHYGIPTRFIDVVDNHWVSLWMGLNRAEKLKQFNQYYHYKERSASLIEMVTDATLLSDNIYQYILLIAVPYPEKHSLSGVQSSSEYIEVDLRQALPSTFLRPHAQHGLVIRRKIHQPTSKGADAYDIAPAVIGIIKVRVDRVHEWLGTGKLLTQDNLFPPPAYDYGYDLLLHRRDLFEGSEYAITQYV